MNPILEDSGMIYYMDELGKVQDGNDWLDDMKHGVIDGDKVKSLRECFWSGVNQRWEVSGEY